MGVSISHKEIWQGVQRLLFENMLAVFRHIPMRELKYKYGFAVSVIRWVT